MNALSVPAKRLPCHVTVQQSAIYMHIYVYTVLNQINLISSVLLVTDVAMSMLVWVYRFVDASRLEQAEY